MSTSMLGRRSAIGLLMALSLPLVPSHGAGAVTSSSLKIVSLTASTKTISAPEGTTTITANVQGGSSCLFTSSPAALSGDVSVPCSNSLSTTYLFPYNATASAITYKVTLTAPSITSSASKSISIKVMPNSGGELFSSPYDLLISAGAEHSCVIYEFFLPYCWGTNFRFDGNLTSIDSSTPLAVVSSSSAAYGLYYSVGLASGTDFSCVRGSYGNTIGWVNCFGNGENGHLGSLNGEWNASEVADVGGTGFLANVTNVAAGGEHACATISDGSVDCWGPGSRGQLGSTLPPGYTYSAFPLKVEGPSGSGQLSGVAKVAVGNEDACAVTSAGGVYCWGANDSGQLGNGTTNDSAAPVHVRGPGGIGYLSNVIDVSIGGGDGGDHACAITKNPNTNATALFCWGADGHYELGNNKAMANGISTTPVQVLAPGGNGKMTNVVKVVTGPAVSCALLVTALDTNLGAVYCWGSGADGLLGTVKHKDSKTPVAVAGIAGSSSKTLDSAYDIAAGGAPGIRGHICAAASAFSKNVVACWGSNDFGQLGNGTTTRSWVPVPVVRR